MKLPVLWIVAALASGALLATPAPGMSTAKPAVWLGLAIAAMLASFGLLLRGRLVSAWVVALLAWGFLGGAAARLERLAIPTNHVTRFLAEGRLDTSEALRWRGRLREDPIGLPWGLRYELDLDEVEIGGKPVPITGGLRASLFQRDNSADPPTVRAGDRVEALIRVRPPRNFGNPGAFDVRGYLARQNIHVTGTLRSAELLQKIGEPPPTVVHRLARARGRLLDRLDALFTTAPDRAAVLRAMLLGDRDFIDHERAEAFQKSAVYHVLVIAGLHVAALAAFVFWAGRWMRLSPLATTLLTLAVLAAYLAIVEDRPPILRAGLMAAMILLARLLIRRVEPLNTIAAAALILLAARPSALADPSFQLSFLAVGTIGALASPWIRRSSEPYRRALDHLADLTRDAAHAPPAMQFRLDARAAAGWLARRMPARLCASATALVTLPCAGALRLWEVFVISATIQLGMLPLLAHYFHRVSLSGLLANIPAVLLTGLIVPIGFLTLGLSLLWTALAGAMAKVLGVLVVSLVGTVEWFARWRWTSYRIPGPPALLLAGFFVALILLALAARAARRRRQMLAAALLALLVVAVATYPFAPNLERGKLEVTVLDVGQGDSIFAAFPDGHTMLIDAGGGFGAARIGGVRTGLDTGEQVVAPYLWSRGLKRLDVVALTHAHQDHLGGLSAVLEDFRVRELWVGRDVANPAFRALIELARAHGVRVVHRLRGDAFTWDGVGGRVLWPGASAEAESPKNNDSLVLRLEHGRVALLLPGDIEGPVERELLANHDALQADLLKVAHHGSKTSTSAEWLAAVSPRAAAISVGETNSFGHPNLNVLARLRAAGAQLFRTDRDGAITALSDGQTLHVRCFLGSR